jgi:hypothetical protein
MHMLLHSVAGAGAIRVAGQESVARSGEQKGAPLCDKPTKCIDQLLHIPVKQGRFTLLGDCAIPGNIIDRSVDHKCFDHPLIFFWQSGTLLVALEEGTPDLRPLVEDVVQRDTHIVRLRN